MTSTARNPLHTRDHSRGWLTQATLAKVPEITLLFWVVKLLTTGMGEAASDWLAQGNMVVAAGIGLVGFLAALWWQLRTDRYRPVTYWCAVAMVAVFGTMAADAVHVILDVPYPVTTALYAVALAMVFALWQHTERSLSIHSITTRRRELFYWATVLATFALGTAAGDLTAIHLHLGYFSSILLFGAAMLVVVLAWWLGRGASGAAARVFGEVTCFWAAYVLTRPLGASIADWLGKPAEKGNGLGLGDGPVTIVALLVFAALVAWLARTGHGVQTDDDNH